ncbi:MAG: hypothetical protein IKF11_03240 [Methanobrevibacter sp.]|nr:hypothetical protein [Methanobrevibacter sp.]
MNIDEIIERECPRYAKKEIRRHNTRLQAIIDTHSGMETPLKVFPLGDDGINKVLEQMNSEYESQLRIIFRGGINEF